MEFPTLAFFAFLLISALGFWFTPKKLQWLVLLLSSLYFYFAWQPAFAGVIVLVTLLSFLAGLAMERFPKQKKVWLIFSLLITFGILGIFKYLGFFALTFDQIFHFAKISLQLPKLTVLLPIGISFFTFQVAGYLIDVCSGKIPPERHLGRYAVLVMFFPKLIAGPIEKSAEFLPQLRQKHTFAYARVVSGLQLFAMGLFKKLVIADNLALVVNHVFLKLPEYKGLSVILTMILFSWQILADFSGYTDMARGAARILGFELMENFRQPYLATSVGEFWRRWHISLSTWLKTYLYIPLGGSRKGVLRACVNTLIVFTVCGLWHGASWNFVLWGAFHGIVLSAERLVQSVVGKRLKLPAIFGVIYTYSIVCVSWVFFRAETLQDAVYILRSATQGVKSFISPTYIWATLSQMFVTNRVEMLIALFALASTVTIEVISAHHSLGRVIRRQSVFVRFAFYTCVLVAILLLRNIGPTEFIYVQF